MSHPDNGSAIYSDLPPFVMDRSVSLTRPAPQKGYEYWKSLLRGRAMPARQDVLPRDMREILSYVGLVEIVALPDGGEDYAMRLIGGKLEEVFGPITDKPLSTSLPAQIATRWREVFDKARGLRAPLAVTGRMGFENKRHLKYELFLAPLGDGDTVTMLFGVLDVWPVT